MTELEEVTTLSGHTAAAWSVCWHPTLPILASCSSDKSIRLYGYDRKGYFSLTSTLPSAHNRTIRQVVFSPDGRRMASASFDSTVGIWERNAKNHEANGHNGSDDESNDEDDVDDWENVGSLEGHESEVKAVAWSYDGALLATCGRDKSVWIWDANTPDDDFECLAVLMDHTQDVKHVVFSPIEEILASSSYDDTIKIYASDYSSDEWSVSHQLPPQAPKLYNFPNAPEPEADESNTGHQSTVWASAFSPDGNYLASVSDDLTIRIWARFKRKDVKGEPGGAFRVGRTEKEGWYLAHVLQGHHDRTIFSVDWTRGPSNTSDGLAEGRIDLGMIATTGGDGKICIFRIIGLPDSDQRSGCNLECEVVTTMQQAHGVYDINCIQWHRPTQSTIGSKSHSAAINGRWRPPPGEVTDVSNNDMEAQSHHDDRMLNVDGVAMLATAADDGTVKVWRLRLSDAQIDEFGMT